MRRSPLTVLALVTAAALAGVSAQPTATAAPSGHPVVGRTTVGPTPPPAFHRALLAAAARAPVPGAVAASRADGLRPVGNGVSTDLPTRLEIGSTVVTIPYTIVVPTGSTTDPAVDFGLYVLGGKDEFVVESSTAGTSGQTTYTGRLDITARTFPGYGPGYWFIDYGSVSTGPVDDEASVATAVRLRSLLGEAATRHGDTVHVVGAAKAFAGQLGYVARPGIRVGIDRYAGNGTYVHLATVTTDRLGHLDTSFRIPWTVAIRLTTPDTHDVFGAATALVRPAPIP